MKTLRLTREFHFEMSHALHGYDGLCKNIHGHSYRLFVTVKGIPEQNIDSPKHGMVLDFSILKKIVKEEIENYFDHALVLNEKSPLADVLRTQELRLVSVPYQPTCENLLVDFAERIRSKLPVHVSLYSLRLYETRMSYAEWFAEDNK